MTEGKEIIIDGVNVAGCNFRLERDNKQKCECCHATGFGVICDCEAWHNCYYKQLKRLEQENKELKEVKEQLKKWDDENLKRQDDMQLWIDLAEEQRRKYRSALEEIRVILMCNYDYPAQSILDKINEVLNENCNKR